MADARGRIIRNLTRPIRGFQALNGNPAWSRNGRKLAFDSKWYGSVIYVVNRDGTDLHRAVFGDDPQWTRDGRLAFADTEARPPQYSSIYTARPDGTDPKLLIDNGRQPAFSRDGRRIAFVRFAEVWVADEDGANARQMTARTGNEVYSYPAWSPDGTRLAYERRAPFNSRTSSIVVARVDTGEELAVLRGPYGAGAYAPSWRPAVTLPRASRPSCR